MDFHIHTPVSQCYEDNMSPELKLNTQPEDIVKAAIGAGLNAMVISDHNAVANIDPIRRVARELGLVIFPGIEITAQGGHMLALFETDTPVDHMSRVIDQMEFPEQERGNGSYSTHFWVDDCARMVEDAGGLAIAAHIDREPRGFVAGYFDREIKQRIHGSDFLGGLEITDPRAKSHWEQGKMRYYSKPYPVVQGSDAHAPGEVGRRPTFIYMAELTLAGLRKAFEEYEDFVKFPAELDRELGR
ncbi:MAG: hypothetical protein HYY02_07585 [Chloroflexi bacterium]|nr:hypothetical protein [Chloroflexota bacterium]